MAPPDFPLLKLPCLGQRHVVWTMTTEEKMFYSLLSQNAKKLITGLHQTSDFLEIFLTNQQIRINPSFHQRPILYLNFSPNDLSEPWPRPFPVSFKSAETLVKLVLRHCETVREWVDHIAEIFHTKNLKLHFQGGSNALDLESVKERFQGYEIIGVNTLNISKQQTQNVLRTFQSIREISWERDPFENEDTEGFEAVIRQKLDYFQFGNDIRGGLDTLIKMDCKIIEIASSELTNVEINGFIKNWIDSDSYKNLEILTVALTKRRVGENYQLKILNGISYSVIPKNQYKEFKIPYHTVLWDRVDEIIGQFEIQKAENGMKATIQLDKVGMCIRFKFIVGK